MLVWAAILIGLAVFLFVIEVFVPSGGIISFFAVLALVAGIAMLFWEDTTLGVVATIITLIAAPFGFAFALRVLPSTPVGKRLTLAEAQTAGTTHYDRNLQQHGETLVGETGVAITHMRPVGTCKIGEARYECLAEGGTIDAGTRVKVVSVSGMEIKVRAV